MAADGARVLRVRDCSAPAKSCHPRHFMRLEGPCPENVDRFEVEDGASLRGPGFLVHYKGESAAVAIAP
jgi:hypothetical protein